MPGSPREDQNPRGRREAEGTFDDELIRQAVFREIRVLRQSVMNGRAASLPNLRRLYQRQLSAGGRPLSGEVLDLTERLKMFDEMIKLERDGMVRRVTRAGHPRYELTELGATLEQPLIALQVWAESHIESVLDARERYDEAEDDRILGVQR